MQSPHGERGPWCRNTLTVEDCLLHLARLQPSHDNQGKQMLSNILNCIPSGQSCQNQIHKQILPGDYEEASSEIHSSIKCLFKETPHMPFLWKTVLYFPSFRYVPVSQSMSLRLKLSYLWYGDRIGKNLTQFLQGLVLELLKSVFEVPYKWVRILA